MSSAPSTNRAWQRFLESFEPVHSMVILACPSDQLDLQPEIFQPAMGVMSEMADAGPD